MKILLAVAAVVLVYLGYKKFSKKKESPVEEPKKDIETKVEVKEEAPILEVVVESKPARKPAAKKPAAKKPAAKKPATTKATKKVKEETKKVTKAKK